MAVQRPGLKKGYNSVRAFHKADAPVLRECIKGEMNRDKTEPGVRPRMSIQWKPAAWASVTALGAWLTVMALENSTLLSMTAAAATVIGGWQFTRAWKRARTLRRRRQRARRRG